MRLDLATLVVDDYDRAAAFFVQGLGFALEADVAVAPGKRWVVVRPRGGGAGLVLAQAADAGQAARIGDQTGGRVALFLTTDDFARDAARIRAAGGVFQEAPRDEAYGRVAVWRDPWGGLWDLIDPTPPPGRSR